MSTKVLRIIGAPGSGKTLVLDIIRERFENNGIKTLAITGESTAIGIRRALQGSGIQAVFIDGPHDDNSPTVNLVDELSGDGRAIQIIASGCRHPAEDQRDLLLDALTPHVLEWVRCGLAANGRLQDGDHPALANLRAAIASCKAVQNV